MQMNFRSAFNGFNREDVVHYIEYLNSKHATELNQLNSELDYLRTRQPEAPAETQTVAEDTLTQQATQIQELSDRCKMLEQELEAVKAEKQESLDRCATLESQLEAANTTNEALAAQIDADQKQLDLYQSRMDEELEAYRRAERTERLAKERAENLCRQANGALADATLKVDNAAKEVGQMTDKVIAQLAQLQDTVAGSKQALRDAAATLYTICPSTDNP